MILELLFPEYENEFEKDFLKEDNFYIKENMLP